MHLRDRQSGQRGVEGTVGGIVAGRLGDGITKCDWWWKAKVEAAEGDVVVGGEKLVRSSFKWF